jgi:hypothetical protein
MTNIHDDGYVLLRNILLKNEIDLLLSITSAKIGDYYKYLMFSLIQKHIITMFIN